MAITPNKTQIEAAGLEYIEPHEIVKDTGPKALNLLAQAVVDGLGGVDEAEVRAIVEGMDLGGIEIASGAVALGLSGAPIREFYTIGATSFGANGTSVLVSSHTAVVWKRDNSGSWSYQQVLDGWTTPTPAPDTTPPTAGTLSTTMSHNSAKLLVSGAADNRGVTGYTFSKDGGTTWVDWQESNEYTFAGLEVDTEYTFRHKVRDAAGFEAIGAAVSGTTLSKPIAPPDRGGIQSTIIADDPVMWLPLQDGSTTGLGTSSAGLTFSGVIPGEVMPDGGLGAAFDGVSAVIDTDLAIQPAPYTIEATFVSNGGNAYMVGTTGTTITPHIGTETVGVYGPGKQEIIFAKVPVGIVTHLVMTFDGSMVRRYVNGIEEGTLAATPGTLGSPPKYRIGGRQNLDRQFNGIIRDVAIYATALTPERILAHAQAQGVSL